MKMDINETIKILDKIRNSGFEIVDMKDCPKWLNQPVIASTYFNKKVNEALE